MGFEPTRAEHIGLAVQRLYHSATSSAEKKKKRDKLLYSNGLVKPGKKTLRKMMFGRLASRRSVFSQVEFLTLVIKIFSLLSVNYSVCSKVTSSNDIRKTVI